jgi:anti-sigma regulatory factor (Ser/Thr protein kinase)
MLAAAGPGPYAGHAVEGGKRRTMGEGTVVIGLDPGTEPEGMTTWPSSSSLPLGALVTATPCARLHTRAVLIEWGLNDLAEAAELIVSELVTNAVRASTGPDGHPRYDGSGLPVVVVRLGTDHTRVLIEVWDVIAGAPVTEQAGPDDESGRGLVLVEAVCERWSWETVPGWPGKVVWAELHVPLTHPAACGNFHAERGRVSEMSGASAGSR